MENIRFFTFAIMFMYFGRKIGWAFSKYILYSVPMVLCIICCVAWGISVAFLMTFAINREQPNIILKWIMGYALAAYVSIPNYGLLEQSSIPDYMIKRHKIISTLPNVTYLVAILAFHFVFLYFPVQRF